MAFLKLGDADNTATIQLANEKMTYLVEKSGTLEGSENRPEAVQAAFLRTSRGWVILDYTGHKTLVNGLRVADCKQVREGDEIRIGEAVIRLFEIRREVVPDGSDLLDPEVICYVCGVGFEVGNWVVYCPVCDAPHHGDCWLFNNESCAAGAHCDYRTPQTARTEEEQDRLSQLARAPEDGRDNKSGIEVEVLGTEELPDDYSPVLEGLDILRRHAQGTNWYQDFALYETQFLDNLRDRQRYGISEQSRRDYVHIMARLNALAFEHGVLSLLFI